MNITRNYTVNISMRNQRLKSPQDFKGLTHFSPDELKAIEHVSKRYAVSVTNYVLETIKGESETDPVARQYLPRMEELKILPEERIDPIGDETHSPVKGIVHRHPDRVLFKPAHVCAVYCRFCFRREMVGPGSDVLSPAEREEALDYIRAHPEIREVILTGGDPLILSARQLSDLLDEIESIEHVQSIRAHTRIPVADPQRVTQDMLGALDRDKPVYICLHINHVQEITPAVDAAIKGLRKAGCILLSQSVLLRGVNDNAEALEDLMRALVARGVKPYYIHHPDLAPGTSHFRLSLTRGRELIAQLHARLSGLGVPRYMLDIPGGYGKVPINSDYVRQIDSAGTYEITDTSGQKHIYKDSADT